MSETCSPAEADAHPIGKIGPFRVGRDGTLTPAAPGICPGFGFRWRGRRVSARMRPGQVDFTVVAAHVPFSAESPRLRGEVIAAVAALKRLLPHGWRLTLSPDHAIRIEAAATLDQPPTVSRLVAAATEFVLALAPVVDLLEEQGARPA